MDTWMWQRLREHWLSWTLFFAACAVAIALLALVVGVPFAIERLSVNNPLLRLFAEDATVRRSSIAGAIGLIVTAFVFFRPGMSRKPTKKPNQDSMAGA